jgi:manganese transport protein
MGEFANPAWLKILAWVITAVIVALNVKLLIGQVVKWLQ